MNQDHNQLFITRFIKQYCALCKVAYSDKYQVKINDTFYSKVNKFYSILSEHFDNIESIGDKFIFEYLMFQYSKYADTDLRRRNILSWLIGKRAWNRWLRKPDQWLYFTYQFINAKHIKTSNFYTRERIVKQSTIRSKYKNNPNRLTICNKLTSGYDNSTIDCVTCIFKKSCRQIKLKQICS